LSPIDEYYYKEFWGHLGKYMILHNSLQHVDSLE